MVFMTLDSTFEVFPSLTTKRLHMRQFQPSDAGDYFDIFSDEQTMHYHGSLPYHTLDQMHARLKWLYTSYAQRELIRWVITLRGDDRLIGSCGLFAFDEGFHRAETGYELNRAYWGQGLMAEAMSAVLTYAFNEMGLHRVEANIDIENKRSKGLLLKLGFTYEGNLRERYVLGDQLLDEHYFGLLDREWHAFQNVSDKSNT
jgi:[ribosomal protein S5]-alanine N-acetyltransferase